MKRLFLLWLSASLLVSCSGRQTTETTHPPNTTASTSATASGTLVATAPAPLTPRLQTLGLSLATDWRQVNLGDSFATAKATESSTPFEEDAAHVGYSQEFSNLESIDYQYIQKNGKVAAIEVDLYLNTAASVQAYEQELATYLTARYGAATRNNQFSTWHSGRVSLSNVTKNKDFGLKLIIRQ